MSNVHPLPAEMVFSQTEAFRKAYEKLDQPKPSPVSRFLLPSTVVMGTLVGSAAYFGNSSATVAVALGLAFASWQVVVGLWSTNRRLEELVSAQMVVLKDIQLMQKASAQPVVQS